MGISNFLPKQMSPHVIVGNWNHLVPLNFDFQVMIELMIMSDYRDLIVKYHKKFSVVYLD